MTAVTPADSDLVRAARGLPVERTPVWFMRQAGRSLPEYRKLREGVEMLASCMRPELVVELTMQPVRRHGVDAAILFSDIVLPLKAAGVDLEIVSGVGPVIASPIRDAAGVAGLPELDPSDVAPISEAVRGLVGELGPKPLIGFAGAPFTLASYLIEGGPSREHVKTKALMVSDEALWHQLAGKLADISLTFLREQVAAGASVVQLFDSWAGTLSPADYERFVLPHSRRVLEGITDVPKIHFGVQTGELLALMASAGADVVGVDWRTGLDDAAARVGAAIGSKPVALQGNLDPTLLFAPFEIVADRARDVLRRGKAATGHIFNLGHGVPPDTDPDMLTRLVEVVHGETVG